MAGVSLFADLVDCADRGPEQGVTPARGLHPSHESLLRDAIERHGGEVVKGTGDGVHAWFPAAAGALDGARQLQADVGSRSTAGLAPTLRARIGLAAGDTLWDSGDDGLDCYGLPVVLAARLRELAEPGQVLCTDLVHLLAGERTNQHLRPVGSIQLRGMTTPTRVVEVLTATA